MLIGWGPDRIYTILEEIIMAVEGLQNFLLAFKQVKDVIVPNLLWYKDMFLFDLIRRNAPFTRFEREVSTDDLF